MILVLKDGSKFAVNMVQAHMTPEDIYEHNNHCVFFLEPGSDPDATLADVCRLFTVENITDCTLLEEDGPICTFSFIELVKAVNFTDTMTKNMTCDVVLKYQ